MSDASLNPSANEFKPHTDVDLIALEWAHNRREYQRMRLASFCMRQNQLRRYNLIRALRKLCKKPSDAEFTKLEETSWDEISLDV